MVRSVALALALVLALVANRASACSCGHGAGPAAFLSYAANRHLPANAKGVLFLSPLRDATTLESGDHSVGYFLPSLPDPLDAAAFSVRDTTTGEPVSVSLRSLGLRPEESWGVKWGLMPFFTLKKPRPGCEFDAYCGQRLFQAGALQQVTKLVSERVGLFRVEPVGGFTPSHTYRFDYGPTKSSVQVIIDATLLETLRDEDGSFAPVGTPARMTLLLPNEMSCTSEGMACVQDLRFTLAPALEPYRDSILFFAESEESGSFAAFAYRPSQCPLPGWGRGAIGAGHEWLQLPLHDAESGRPPRRVRGSWRFLEVDPATHWTEPQPLAARGCD